ncbi:MAG: hypothetical protein B6U69_02040 [Thermofilum sp. ex4484_15]|nr:MAG: hypothetical protein B6U69_02040 [Thermofilum sp. ex4484_15]
MNRAIKVAGIITALVLSCLIAAPSLYADGLPKEIPIGALLAMSGPLSTFGKREAIAAQMAIEDVNAYVAKLGLNVKFKLYIEDTKVSPEEALARLSSLAAQGVKVVIGPMASSEVAAIKSFADSNRIVVISQSSTAFQLAIPGDYIFRFVPTDLFQGKALAKLAEALGLKKVAVIYRGDAWGDGLFAAFKANFERIGGVVEGVRYDPASKDLSPEVRRLSSIVSRFGAGPDVGVLMISFEDDGISILTVARDDPVLMKVKWFGTDGTAQSTKMVEEVGPIMAKLGGFPSTLFQPAMSPKQREFAKRFEKRAGEAPDAYSLNVYDAVWVVALAIIESRSYDGETIAKILPDVASHYFGVSGWTILDANGDRAFGDYAIWSVVKKGKKYVWEIAGMYSYITDKVTFYGK